jgi:hypothetical protein
MSTRAAFAHFLAKRHVMLLLALLPPLAIAQQQPLTGQMMDGHPSGVAMPAPAPMARQVAMPAPVRPLPALDEPMATPVPAPASAAVAPPSYAAQVGDTTRGLLQMQVDNDRVGERLPMLGDEASASYRRYLKSFDHDIPEFYETTVGKGVGNGR